jgi:hypothetical protein
VCFGGVVFADEFLPDFFFAVDFFLRLSGLPERNLPSLLCSIMAVLFVRDSLYISASAASATQYRRCSNEYSSGSAALIFGKFPFRITWNLISVQIKRTVSLHVLSGIARVFLMDLPAGKRFLNTIPFSVQTRRPLPVRFLIFGAV